MLYIFEMANNHMGSVDHAKNIVDEFSSLAKERKLTAGVKLQFRNLDTFIHPDFQQRNDLKYVKRFNETRLSKEQFKEIIDYIKASGLLAITTPFDNESIPMTSELNLDVLKVASCSVDDWPLLEELSTINKRIIISTAGVGMDVLRKVYSLFKQAGRDFAFMHCVGEYPTNNDVANLDRIKELKQEFPDIEIGFSTHESPLEKSMTPFAVAMGCTIVEKHVGVPTDEWPLNAYSLTKDQMNDVLQEVDELHRASVGKSNEQINALKSLKRGIYVKRDLPEGHVITKDDIYFAMPVQENMLNTSSYHDVIGSHIIMSKLKNEGLYTSDIKKILVVLPNQSHPTHRHMIKEESFELLSGDCNLVLNGQSIDLTLGQPKHIMTKVDHSFSSKGGCVVEEVSTTHIAGDSIYQNPKINKLSLEERKIKISL